MTTPTHNPDHYPHNGGNADLDLLCRACEMGMPTKRAMPGPPEHWDWDGRSLEFYDRDGLIHICPDWWFRQPENSKTLTDAEAAAEKWRALSSAMFLKWAPLNMLGVEIPADGQLYSVTRPDPTEAEIEAETWHRFATLPHALEVGA